MKAIEYLKTVFSNKSAKVRMWYQDQIPIFSDFGRDVYFSDYVNNAIDRVATEISKIEVRSVVEKEDTIITQNDEITRLFKFKPNPLQTTTDFLANVEWLRRKHGNVFIYPQYELLKTPRGQLKRFLAFYPLNPTAIYIGINKSSVWEIRFDFEDGSSYTLPYSELIHLKWRRGVNTIIGGGDDNGRSNTNDLLRTVKSLDKIIQGIPKSIESSMQVKGVYSAKSLADAQKINKIRDDFEDHMSKSKAGIVAIDLAGEFTPVNMRSPEIPKTALTFLKDVIQERYGVSAAILSGDYNGDQHSAFFQTAIEDFLSQGEQAFSDALFTQREKDVGHKIRFYYDKVSYMSTENKLEIANLAKETGLMTLNQINEMFGIEPFKGGDRRLQSLNYVNIDDVDKYQKSKAGVGKVKDEPKGEEDE